MARQWYAIQITEKLSNFKSVNTTIPTKQFPKWPTLMTSPLLAGQQSDNKIASRLR